MRTSRGEKERRAPHRVELAGPVRLGQLQDAANLIRRALRELEALRGLYGLSQCHRQAELLAACVTRAREAFLLPARHVFPNLLFAPAAFSPPLPPELVIDFSIVHRLLRVDAFLLHLHPSGQRHPPTKPSAPFQDQDLAGHSLCVLLSVAALVNMLHIIMREIYISISRSHI